MGLPSHFISNRSSWSVFPFYKKEKLSFAFFSCPEIEELISLRGLSLEQKDDYLNKIFNHNLSNFSSRPIVTHIPYDFYYNGHISHKNFIPSALSETLVHLKYKKIDYMSFEKWKEITRPRELSLILKKSFPFSQYQKNFLECQRELKKGYTYQINLSTPFLYQFNKNLNPVDFLTALWREQHFIAPFAHATWVAPLQSLILSNSPECLFQIQNDYRLQTMPIKGTIKLGASDDKRKAWTILNKSKKDHAELNMITDLMRNDLSKIHLPNSRVIKKKCPLIVPGLIHQYSLIEVDLSPEVKIKKIWDNIFPGGSITGAPKKSTIDLLYKIEKRRRGHYCGSTFLQFKKAKCSSINIRTAEIDFKGQELLYNSGGGITLLSKLKEEYAEILGKRDSFIKTLKI